MSTTAIRLAGLVVTVCYGAAVVWVYAQQPRTMAQVRGGVASTLGSYHIDQTNFGEGLRFFQHDQFGEARAAFARADQAEQDPRTQFYVAYSYYRQGWGRLSSDDTLFRAGLDAVNRAIALSPDGRVIVDDPGLAMHSADELKAELERGLTIEPGDFNPLRVLRPRK